MEFELSVSLSYNTPVVGCEIFPIVRLKVPSSPLLPLYSITFTWYREQIACSIHDTRSATVQCISCIKLKIPFGASFHCSVNCFIGSWEKHLECHCEAGRLFTEAGIGDQQAPVLPSSSGFWTDFESLSLLDQRVDTAHQEGNQWVKVGSSETYVPSISDTGYRLRLVSVVMDHLTGSSLSSICILVTDPVITFPTRCPRHMIQVKSPAKSLDINPQAQPHDFTFSVLSYNILSDLYANRTIYSYCPTWALAWEYRRKNLLQEIVEYDADILCLQEVQSDHFETFFKPELIKCGYAVVYKKRTKEVYTANHYITDGCATCFRRALFREIVKYELEFDKMALSVVESLDPKLQTEGSIRLMKDNVALVLILEVLDSGITLHNFRPRICVANTHIHANSHLPDVKLYQVARLVHGLEKVSESQVPLLICGDFNSLPESDPHKFLVQGKIGSRRKSKRSDPLGIYPLLKLNHSLPLASAYTSFFDLGEAEEQCLSKMNDENKEPLFTCFRQGLSGTLDYILYTEGSLRVEGLLDLLDLASVSNGLPSPLWSSDHIALMARFRLMPPARKFFSPPSLPSNPWEQSATA